MTKILCRICLRTGFTSTGPIDKRLTNFHDELCDYDIFHNKEYQFCSSCKYELRKFYNFRQRCRKAHKILKTCRRNKGDIDSLHAQMPPNNQLAFATLDNQKFYTYNHDLTPYIILNLTADPNTQQTYTYVKPTPQTAVELDKQTSSAITSDTITSFVINEAANAIDDTSYIINEVSHVIDNTSYVLEPNDIDEASNETNDVYSVTHNEASNELCEIHDPISLPQTNTHEGNIHQDAIPNIQNDKEVVNNIIDNLNIIENNAKCNVENKIVTINKDKPLADVKDDNLEDDDESEVTLHEIKKGLRKRTKKQKPKTVYKKRKKTKKSDSDSENDMVCVDELKYKTKKMSADDKKVFKLHKKIQEFKERVSWLLDNGKIDLGEDIDLNKESFLKMFEKCDKTPLAKRGLLKNGPGVTAKLKKFLLFLLKRYNPEYESVFDIEYLTTQQMKITEFEARKEADEYTEAEYKCLICFKVFEVPRMLDYHNKWHDPSRPHGCDICSMRFSARKHLMVHHRTSHYSVYRCKLCPIVTYIFEAMVNHYDQHKGKQYKCDVCLGEYNSKSSLNTHRLSHATIACAHCARRFVSSIGLKNHMKLKHPEIPLSTETVSCEKCNIDFDSRDQLRKHNAKVHQRTHNYKCLYIGCVERFVSSAELRAHAVASGHVRRRDPTRPALHGAAAGGAPEPAEAGGEPVGAEGEAVGAEGGAAGVGGVPARKRRTPRKPRAAIMGPDKPYRTCPVCQEQVLNKCPTSLYKHHAAKHPSLPYSCAAEPEMLCEQCGKSFVHRSVYLDHLNTHSGEKPYECNDCGARFHMRRSLATHSERHRPPRYQCKDCGKMFLTSANLFCHRRTHIGDRRFKCEICLKGFLHTSSLKEHIKGVHHQIRRAKKTK